MGKEVLVSFKRCGHALAVAEAPEFCEDIPEDNFLSVLCEGGRIEVMTLERFKAEFAPTMLCDCAASGERPDRVE